MIISTKKGTPKDELEKIVAEYLEKYVDRHFKSLEILKMIVE